MMSTLSADIRELEFSDEINKLCYLNMMVEVIFSPDHKDGNPFKYFPHLQESKKNSCNFVMLNHPNSNSHREGTTFEQT